MKNKKIEIAVITAILILQTVLYAFCCTEKSYLHMDESYSFGLSNYHNVHFTENSDFYNTWHDSDYFKDYLTVNSDEAWDLKPVYENQKNDVHPPFYYLLLRVFMEFSGDGITFWSGLVLNIIIHLFITLFNYLILKELLADKPYYKEISAFAALVAALTLSAFSGVAYIRMYSLLTLEINITTYLHLRLRSKARIQPRDLLPIGISAFLGSLTHYYFLFYLAAMFIIFVVYYCKNKSYRNLLMYIAVFVLAAACSLKLFPYSFDHLFLGYRGQGALENISDNSGIQKLISCFAYITKLDVYAFNSLFFIIVVIISVLLMLRLAKLPTESIDFPKGGILILSVPPLVYFIIAAIASPWIELRYILPVCPLLFISSFVLLFRLAYGLAGARISRGVSLVLAFLMLLSPVFLETEPEFLYKDKADTVSRIQSDSDAPAVYFLNESDSRFLDDILLFAEIEESYITNNTQITADGIRSIFADKDTSEGVIVFINNGWNNDSLLKTLKDTLNLTTVEHINRMNACDIYFLS